MKKDIIYLILTIAICVPLSGCLDDTKNDEKYYSYSYDIRITPNQNNNYSVIIPVLLNKDGEVSNINDKLNFISGSGEFKIFDSEKGKAMQIESSSEITLSAVKVKTNGIFDVVWNLLSLEQNTSYDGNDKFTNKNLNYWVKLENGTSFSSVNIEIIFKASLSKGTYGYDSYSECKGEVNLKDEWQIINGNRVMETWDKN